MASSTSQRSLLVIVLLSISVLSVMARPCKTFFVSSYSFSLREPSSLQFHSSSSSSGFVTVFTEIRPLNDAVLIEEEELDESRFQRRPLRLPLLPVTSSSTTSYDLSSLRDRTKDILSVVVALLFGVGSGALVAATMYLASSLFWNRFDYRSSSPYGDDTDEEEDLSPKKIGYVKVPAAESESVPAPATAKETETRA
ncbi:uncharacterized protein LOC107415656 [Ziziphus jujuba]|uniref:Uncharacterized protein LOC107415656 n=1 Tax=Ziziphus jujuba TaxID=326968 RepID=A0A6P3ZVI2_ZIZJJ|nr:uncharacterized protein LOC107415656 [Ziziphus jujuba]